MVVVVLTAGWSMAQGGDDAGVVGDEAEAPVEVPVDAGVAAPPATALPAPAAPSPVAPVTALERRRGSVGVGYLGGMSVGRAFGAGTLGGVASHTTVPVLGLRWWTPLPRVGVELGAGVMVTIFDADGVPPPAIASVGETVELAWHVAVPIALVSAEHAIVVLAPQFRVGHSLFGNSTPSTTAPYAWTFDFSLKGGVEVFFGFIGLDRLSLEASIRVGLAHDVRTTVIPSPLQPNDTFSTYTTRFSTSVSGSAWDVVASSLALRYYF